MDGFAADYTYYIRELPQSALRTAPSGMGPLAVHADFISLPRPLPLGEVDANVVSRRRGRGRFPAAPPLPQEAGAVNAVRLYDSSRENGIPERPQTLRYAENINNSSAEDGQSKAEAILDYFFFSCSVSPSRGVMYTVVYTSYSTMPGLAPLAFQMFFTSVVSTATLAPVPAL